MKTKFKCEEHKQKYVFLVYASLVSGNTICKGVYTSYEEAVATKDMGIVDINREILSCDIDRTPLFYDDKIPKEGYVVFEIFNNAIIFHGAFSKRKYALDVIKDKYEKTTLGLSYVRIHDNENRTSN